MTVSSGQHPLPPDSQAEADWVEWVNTNPSHIRMGVRCRAIRPEGGVFDVESSFLPTQDERVAPGIALVSVADVCAGAVAACAANDGAIAVTGDLHARIIKESVLPATVHVTAGSRVGNLQPYAVGVTDDQGESVLVDATMIFTPRSRHPGYLTS